MRVNMSRSSPVCHPREGGDLVFCSVGTHYAKDEKHRGHLG